VSGGADSKDNVKVDVAGARTEASPPPVENPVAAEASDEPAGRGGEGGRRERAPGGLADVLALIERQTEGQPLVRIEDIFDAFEGRLFGPLIVAPSVIVVSPLGAIPMAPSVMGILLALIAGQRLLGRTQPWTPRRLRRRGVERERMLAAFARVRPMARWTDRWLLRPRLTPLVGDAGEIAIATVVTLLGLSLPVVGLVPGAAFVPGLASLLLGLALTARDGLLALLGLLVAAGMLASGVVVPFATI